MSKLDPSLESKDLNLLSPLLQEGLAKLTKLCQAEGIELRVGCTVRGPAAQAKLWCRSRCVEELEVRRQLIGPRAPTLASLLKDEWAGVGPFVTEHLQSQSWHQWGEAADIYGVVAGKAIWDGSIVKPMANLARELGLWHSYWTKRWSPKFRHWHIQLNELETPFLVRGFLDSWEQAEVEMLKRFEL